MGPERTPLNLKIAGAVAGLVIVGIGGNEIAADHDLLWYSKEGHHQQVNPDLTPITQEAPTVVSQVITDQIEISESRINTEPFYIGGRFNQKSYRDSGIHFRNTIQILEEFDDPRAEELKAFYSRLKDNEGGREYTQMREEITPHQFKYYSVPFEPKGGDTFSINDPAIKKIGIYLRENAEEINTQTDTTFLYKYMEVKLIESKVVPTDEGDKVFWKVSVEDNRSYVESGLEAEVGETGYISQEFLGTQIKRLGQ